MRPQRPSQRAAGFAAAFDLVRRHGAPLFELRAALDDFELRGQPAREALIDAAAGLVRDSPLPELARVREILGSTGPRVDDSRCLSHGCGAEANNVPNVPTSPGSG